MRISALATMLTLTTLVCFGCGGGTGSGGGSSDSGGKTSSGGSGGGGGSSDSGKTSSGGSGGGGGSSDSGGKTSSGGSGGGSSSSKADTSLPSEPFEIEGSWLFLGPDSLDHTITITSKSMKYASVNEPWESTWTLRTYDNKSGHFQMVFDSGKETYYPSEKSYSGTFKLEGMILIVQLAKGLDTYPEIKDTSCLENSNPIPDCRRYMKTQ